MNEELRSKLPPRLLEWHNIGPVHRDCVEALVIEVYNQLIAKIETRQEAARAAWAAKDETTREKYRSWHIGWMDGVYDTVKTIEELRDET